MPPHLVALIHDHVGEFARSPLPDRQTAAQNDSENPTHVHALLLLDANVRRFDDTGPPFIFRPDELCELG